MKKLFWLVALFPVLASAETASEKVCQTENHCLQYSVTIPNYSDPDLVDFALKITFDVENKTLADLPTLVSAAAEVYLAEGWGDSADATIEAETRWSEPVTTGNFQQIFRQDMLTATGKGHNSRKIYFILQKGEENPLNLSDILTEKGKTIFPEKILHSSAQKLAKKLNVSEDAAEMLLSKNSDHQSLDLSELKFHFQPQKLVIDGEYSLQLTALELKGLVNEDVLSALQQWSAE